jgi:L-ascorbate metabolism protein UlaG (beta-lactamase superfamily)
MWIVLLIVLSIPLLFFVIGASLSGPKYKGPVSDHFDGKQFINPGGMKAKGLREVFKWMFTRKRSKWVESTDEKTGARPLAFIKEGIRITFVNHSTFLIQVNGVNILTDPVWSKRVSPFQWAGPKRMRPPGIKLEDLPRIHFVLLSHNHYDHLDIQTVRIINGAHHPKFITPLGVKAFLDQQQVSGATDLDWWDELTLTNDIKVQAVPAQHFSGRGSLDRDATLWCGYVLNTPAGKIYFAGDTGYNDFTFKEIGEKFSGFDVSIIPIGAYKPRWFMSPIHVDPEQAVKIHMETKSKLSIASHFGTFPLADDGKEDPINELEKALQTNNLPATVFITLQEGESRDIATDQKSLS